ncbi:CHAT domain-containing tetratricopeptide repeat protein [Deinococcus sp. QL22]|uniref:CHAT domain-containing tetratricopeptide repeat protein n=1 Tax=Deinococcus sp. QL22 TaxID=2939437 RepID=UPI00201732C7|nr:CHAT domain-containing tetratricopeptide repeat protein [Deinococcus sp. QL22]UQN08806.1 CHAT domain-containing protein [Deinococcus sp. QL22]
MTNDPQASALFSQFLNVTADGLTSEAMDKFQAQLHTQFPKAFDLHFILIELIASKEDDSANEHLPILRRALRRQHAQMHGRPKTYLGHARRLGMQYIQDRALHLAAPVLEEVSSVSRHHAPSEWLSDLVNLATLQKELQHFEKSIATHREVLELLGGEREATPVHANAWHSLGQVYGSLKQYPQAVESYTQALKVYRASRAAENNDIADVLNDLGTVYRDQGRLADAFRVHREGLDLQKAAARPNHAAIALSLNNLGNLHFDRDELDEAEAFYQEAFPLARRYSTAADQALAITNNNLAQVRSRRGDTEKAVRLMEEAVQLRRISHSSHHSDLAETLRNLANAYSKARQWNQAVTVASEAFDIEIANEQFPVSSKHLNADERRAEKGLELLLHLMFPLVQVGEARDWTNQVTALLTYKGNAEIEQGLASILHAAASGELEDILERRQHLQGAIAQARYGEQRSDGAVDQWMQELQSLDLSLEKHPEARRLADELRLRKIQPASVTDALQSGEALLNYLVVGEKLFAQILHQDGEHHFVYFDATGVKEWVGELQHILRSQASEQLYLSHPELQRVLRHLYDVLLAPMEQMLRLGTRLDSLVISGDSYLYGLPWDLLLREHESGSVALIEQVSIRLIPTPRDLVRLHRLEELQAAELSSALLLGVQTFETGTDESGETGDRAAELDFPTRAGLGGPGSLGLPRYRNLAGTRLEVELLTETLQQHGLKVQALLSPRATEQTLLHLSPAPSVLHFATHSDVWTPETAQAHYVTSAAVNDVRLNPAHPFSRAVVILDGYNGKSFRGVLRGWELASLHLSGTQMVMFSSCDSGLGDMTAGRSVAGLSQAAFLAGARRTITTLWPVSDAEAPQWIADLYQRRLEGASWQEAVRSSKLTMLEDEHPLGSWAPFVLNGLA